MDRPITCIPGLGSLLRPCNLPDDISALEPNHPLFELIIGENSAITSRASALILDTFDDLEAPIISRINSVIPKTYTVGPLHALLEIWAAANSSPALDFSTSLWKEERSCMAWLDSKPTKSVSKHTIKCHIRYICFVSTIDRSPRYCNTLCSVICFMS